MTTPTSPIPSLKPGTATSEFQWGVVPGWLLTVVAFVLHFTGVKIDSGVVNTDIVIVFGAVSGLVSAFYTLSRSFTKVAWMQKAVAVGHEINVDMESYVSRIEAAVSQAGSVGVTVESLRTTLDPLVTLLKGSAAAPAAPAVAATPQAPADI